MKKIQRETAVALLLEMRVNGQHLAWGSGFVAQSRTGHVLITNRHNVTGRDNNTGVCLSSLGAEPDEIVVQHHRQGAAMGQWVSRAEPLKEADGRPRWIEHPSLREKADFVALPLTELDSAEIHAIDLTEARPAIRCGPAEPVSVIGYPFGKSVEGGFPIWATGFIASEPVFNHGGLPCLLIDCRTRPGQSGSPVIAFRPAHSTVAYEDGAMSIAAVARSRFLGIYSGRIRSDSDLGIVWKASAVRELVDSIGRSVTYLAFDYAYSVARSSPKSA